MVKLFTDNIVQFYRALVSVVGEREMKIREYFDR